MSKALHIGLILPALPGYSEVFINNKMNGLLNHGFEVSLFVAGKGNSTEIALPVPVYYQVNVNNKLYMFFAFITTFILHPISCIRFLNLERDSHGDWTKALKHLILNFHIIGKSLDWLHFCFTTAGIGRENLSRAMGARSAVSFRGFDIGLYSHQHPGCYDLLWKKIDKVHTISDDLYKQAIDLGLPPKIPYKKITPAINTEFFKSNVKENLHNPLRILTVGRLTWKKGYEYALKALVLLKDKKINFEYCIVGEGNYRETIKYAIHQLKLTENIILKGQLSHEDVKHEMEWADIYIQPSIQEGFCNAVLEAQAMGLLCIVTNAEGLSENVLDGKTGWVVEKRNPIAINEQILTIIESDEEDLKKIRNNAINRVNSTFNIEIQKENFSNFYSNK